MYETMEAIDCVHAFWRQLYDCCDISHNNNLWSVDSHVKQIAQSNNHCFAKHFNKDLCENCNIKLRKKKEL